MGVFKTNRLEQRGSVVALAMSHKGTPLECLLDAEDVQLITSGGKVRASWALTSNTFYARTNKGYVHRLVMNAPKGQQVDHVNHNGLDNRKVNLRIVSRSENLANRKGPQANNRSSGIRGVHWHSQRRKWTVRFRKKYYGIYETKEQAQRAAQSVRINAGCLS